MKTSIDRFLGNYDINYLVEVSCVPRQLPRNVTIDKLMPHGYALNCGSENDYFAVIRLCRMNRLLYKVSMQSKNSWFACFNAPGSRVWDAFWMFVKLAIGSFGGGFVLRRI